MSALDFDTDRRVIALGLARMADSIGNSFLIIVLPLYIASGYITGGAFGLEEALITGVILSAYGFFNSAIQPFAGRLSDRTGRRRAFVVFGLIILAIANFSYSLVNSYALMILVRLGQGLGVAFTIPATIALVNDLSAGTTRGGNMGAYNTFRLLGFGIGPLMAGSVINGGPYRLLGLSVTGFEAAFYIASFSAALGAVLVLALVSDPDVTDAEAGDELDIAVFHDDGDAVLDPVFTLGLVSLFMAMSIALLSPLETLINEHLNQGPFLFGVEFAAFVLAQVVVQTPIGAASDRYGRKPFILAGLLLLVPATLAQGLVVAPWQMIVARLVQGVAGAMVFAPAFALAGDYAGRGQSGTTLSVLTMAFGLGTAIGPLSAGYLVQFGYVVPFAAGAAFAGLGAVLVYTQVSDAPGTGAESAGGAASTVAGQD